MKVLFHLVGVSFLGRGLVVTSSIDQRLTVWRVGQSGSADRGEEDSSSSLQSCTPELVHSQTHDVADASSLTLYQWQ